MATESPERVSSVSGGETALYRHFDAEGRLLYVGVSLNTVARLAQHRSSAHWFGRIASMSVQRFPSRAEALAAEAAAIRDETPECNILGRRGEVAEDCRREALDDTGLGVGKLGMVYDASRAAWACGLSRGALLRAIEAGDVRAFKAQDGTPRVTGWALVEYITRLEDGELEVRPRPPKPVA